MNISLLSVRRFLFPFKWMGVVDEENIISNVKYNTSGVCFVEEK